MKTPSNTDLIQTLHLLAVDTRKRIAEDNSLVGMQKELADEVLAIHEQFKKTQHIPTMVDRIKNLYANIMIHRIRELDEKRR